MPQPRIETSSITAGKATMYADHYATNVSTGHKFITLCTEITLNILNTFYLSVLLSDKLFNKSCRMHSEFHFI